MGLSERELFYFLFFLDLKIRKKNKRYFVFVNSKGPL